MERQQRIQNAIDTDDNDYIEDFRRGSEASEQEEKLNDQETQAFRDGYEATEEQKTSPTRNRLVFSPHPMGGVGVTLIGSDGTVNQGRLELDAASLAHTHLGALLTMMIQTAYMMQAQAAETTTKSGLVIPGR